MGGIFIARRFKKQGYGDLRDYEPLVVGVPAVLMGVALVVLYIVLKVLGIEIHLNPLGQNIFVAALQVGVFLAKVLFFCFFFIWVRWTLPRLRYDQLMRLGWKTMLPLALVNLLVTGLVVLWI